MVNPVRNQQYINRDQDVRERDVPEQRNRILVRRRSQSPDEQPRNINNAIPPRPVNPHAAQLNAAFGNARNNFDRLSSSQVSDQTKYLTVS